ncbi:MAG: hypothetical protein M0Z52_12420 [Actinomycetota bacterium]|nr:hypothetical protein [Actinomycetota bacterium]
MLNDSQKRKVSITMSALEEDLIEIEGLLRSEDYIGMLYELGNDIPLPMRRELLYKIASIKRDIKNIAEQFGLYKQPKKLSSRISWGASVLWASIAEIKAGNLKGYGGIAEGLEEALDPALETICEELIEIQRIASEFNRKE